MPRKAKRAPSDPSQLPPTMPAPPVPAKAAGGTPEQETKVALARRVSAVPGHLKLVFTLDLRRELAERLAALAIREGKNLDALVIELVEEGARWACRSGRTKSRP